MSNPKCLCGCGHTTKGGKFKPGHDAKLHSKYQDGKAVGKAAMAVIRSNGWKR